MAEYLSILAENTVKDLAATKIEVLAIVDAIKSGSVAARELTTNLGSSGTQKDLSSNFIKATAAQNELSRSIQEYQKLQNQVAAQEAKLAALQSESAKTQATNAAAIREATKALTEQANSENASVQARRAASTAAKQLAADEKELLRLIKEEEKSKIADQRKAEAQATRERAAAAKQLAIDEKELLRLIKEEERVKIADQRKADAQASRNKSAADKEYISTYKTLLNERQKEEKLLNDLNNEYKLLSQQLDVETKKYQQLFLTVGENNKATLDQLKIVQQLDGVLKKVDANTGNYRRNVGNYEGATRNLQFSIQQIARELPSLSGGFAIFASAIGNNIAPAQDAIKSFRKEQALLKAEGKPTTSVFQAISGSIFSFNTLLILGVTLLTVYGKEIGEVIKELVKGKEKFTDAQLAAKGFTQAIKESSHDVAEVVSKVTELKQRFTDAKASVEDKKLVIEELNKAYGDTIGKIKGINEAEQFFVERSDAFIRAITLRAEADGARAAISKNTQQQLERESKSVDEAQSGFRKYAATLQAALNPKYSDQRSRKDVLASIGKIRDRILKEDKEIKDAEAGDVVNRTNTQLSQMILGWEREANAIAQKFKFNLVKDPKEPKKKQRDYAPNEAQYEADTTREIAEQKRLQLQIQADYQRAIVTDENEAYSTRAEAQQKYYAFEQQIAKIAYDAEKKALEQEIASINEQISKETKNQSKREALAQKRILTEEKIKTATTKYNKETSDAEIANTKSIEAIRESSSHKLLLLAQQDLSERQAIASAGFEEQNKLLKSSLKRGEITQKQYDIELKNLSTQRKIDELTTSKEVLNNLLIFGNLTREDYDKTKSKIDEIIAAINDLNTKTKESVRDSFNQNDYLKFGQDAIGVAQTLYSIEAERFNARMQQLEAENKAIDANLAKQINAINLSGDTSIEKQRKILEAEAEAQSKREQLESRQKDLKRKAAISERSATIASVILETSLAVIRALSDKTVAYPIRVAYAISAGAIGAAQIAKVLATPIPEYEEGTDFHKGGPALVHKNEIVMERGGKTWHTGSAKETFLPDLPRGSRVISEDQINKSLFSTMYGSALIPRTSTKTILNQREVTEALNKQTKSIVKAVQGGYVKPKSNIFGSSNRSWVHS